MLTICHIMLMSSFALQLASVVAGVAPAAKRSAVFILVDDLGHNDVAYNNRSSDGSTAGRGIHSPNIDEMADTGIKLLQYYVHPICTPTRSALMVGWCQPSAAGNTYLL